MIKSTHLGNGLSIQFSILCVALRSAPTDVQGPGICLGDTFAALSLPVRLCRLPEGTQTSPKAKVGDNDNLNIYIK